MAEPMEISSSSEPLNLQSVRRRISELSDIHSSNENEIESEALSSDSEKLLNDYTSHFESKVKQIIEEYSDVGFLGIEDFDCVMTLENWEQEEGNKGLMRSELDDIVSFDVKIPNARDILMNHVTVEMDHISEHDLRLNDETKMNAECFTVLGSSRLPQC
ncbi:hypothetical protein GQ457_03G025580 [Hibiscus cannabinus]